MYIETSDSKYLVKFFHGDFVNEEKPDIVQKGTTCVVKNVATGEEWVGMAVCSLKDMFSRKVGRKISLERALLKFSPKWERAEIWAKYFEKVKK